MQNSVALEMETVLSAAALETSSEPSLPRGVAEAENTARESKAVARTGENIMANGVPKDRD